MSDDLLKRSNFRMPVYACGYNWLASNEKSAERLQTKINKIIAENNVHGRKCEQVIIVTHSMGGLVARRCAISSGMQDKIAGIVHGVMPAIGAAVAYRRCKLGMQEEGAIAGAVIGANGQEVTAVFAQAPGPLQLLPTAEYHSQWLKILDAKGVAINIQPVNDPYNDIYLRRDRWWGLVREEWLSPANGQPIVWDVYEKNIAFTKAFHQSIRDKYHPDTYVYYGVEKEYPSFENIEWRMAAGEGLNGSAAPLPHDVGRMGFNQVRDLGTNPGYVGGRPELRASEAGRSVRTVETSYWTLHCGMQDGGGDGTVPASSGRSPLEKADSCVRQQFRLSGFEHEGAFRNSGAQQVSLYGLVKIASKAKVPA